MLRIYKSLTVVIVVSLFAVFILSGAGVVLGEAEKGTATETCDCSDCAQEAEHADCDHEGHDEEVHADQDEHADCDHDEHGDDDHDEHADHEVDEHAGHDHEQEDAHVSDEDHEGHDHGQEQSNIIRLDHESEQLIGVKTIRAEAGAISSEIRLTGQIRLNEDRLAHIVPLTSGIVRKVNSNMGDSVKKDDILAWIESAELGQAKVKYLDIQAEVGCCAMILDRTRQIHDNTLKLIDVLKSNPGLDGLEKLGALEMGENRSSLIKAYSEYVLARSVYEREKPLYEQKISSQQEYLLAENRLKKARAEYTAMQDTVQYRIQQDLLEATSDQNRLEIALRGAERTLYVLGQTEEDIQRLDSLALNPYGLETSEESCPDPDCESCRKKAEQGTTSHTSFTDFRRLGWYPLRASFDGTVIEKHVTMGERLSQDAAAFTVADLNTVWIDLSVFPKDLPFTKKGQICRISSGNQTFDGRISFLSPVLDTKTRTATARVIIDNSDGNLKPGLFVTATVSGKAEVGKLVIPTEAVQMINGKHCVFVDDGEDFELRPVTLGHGNAGHVEILSGLGQGEQVVTQGAFDLKAKIVTSTLDSHAGHGH